jgi:glycerophosphoryl diester phosphodiesterase
MSPLTVSKPAGASEPWPHPRWIAHRGAGTLAPENTWAAFELGAQWGFSMFECDVRHSADGVWFLMHDDTLERTTNGQGLAEQRPWAELLDLDAGAWHSPQHAGQGLPTLDALLAVAQQRAWCLNLELKPPEDPTTARQWGAELGRWLSQHPHGLQHWVTSFSTDALAGLQAAAP